jgi:hypothetical protein
MTDLDKMTNKERFAQNEARMESIVQQVHHLTDIVRAMGAALDQLNKRVSELEDGPKTGLVLPNGQRLS